jgi:exodeoxyribonuclease V alpha subunit
MASGDWVNDRTNGQQFRASFMRTSAPSSVEGIQKYLSSGMIRGIGPSYASKMVKAFGDKVFDIIEAEPDREVDGIGPNRAQRITAAWAEKKIVREIVVVLHSHGGGTARAVRIDKTYGTDAIQVMTENLYSLPGTSVASSSRLPTRALRLGIERTAMIRARAGISYALSEAKDEGLCDPPTEELVPIAAGLLGIPKELVTAAAGTRTGRWNGDRRCG